MKNLLLLLALLAVCSFNSTSYAQRVKIPCPTTLNDINDCPDTGCGNVVTTPGITEDVWA